ncbi:SIR2 family protein [Mycobacterium intracellulare]|uniref:SIR2 family protein n=2 Tax=Mycobacterium intracellulare TaxID=1767 RepID=UPI001CDA6104|nr:SIR2 family protein [Mycobacterium intracellulare]MCA2357766.1 SIR2 family protein [Mycobacterium intracellulare]MCA2367036.1 SIR2 family protein [Mycobacterium intracellulare]
MNSPTWDALLEMFATRLGQPMSYYRGKADGDLPRVASLLADDLYEPWFKSKEYAESRSKFAHAVMNRADPMKYEIAKYLKTLKPPKSGAMKAELETFARVHAQAVLTTNWDDLIETTLPDYETFVGQNDVLFTTIQSVGEIYKIHGSVSDPQSLVLTQEDYRAYWERNPYLIAKMLTLFVEHPILFIGYSVSDPHIRRLLSNLVECLTPAQRDVLNDRLVFVDRRPAGHPPEFTQGSLTVGNHSIAIRQYALGDYSELYGMLASLPRRFPAKLMRQLKESVYKLAYDSTPQGRLRVLDIAEGDNLDDLEVVVGVGTSERLAEIGYGHYSREDLIRDMLFGATQHNADALMTRTIPELFSLVKYLPIYYPLRLAGRISSDGTVTDKKSLPRPARELLNDPSAIYPPSALETSNRRNQSFRELLSEGERLAINHGVWCQYELNDVLALGEFLAQLLKRSRKIKTEVARLACKYDRLVYGFDYKGNMDELLAALDLEMPRQAAG